MIRGIGTDIVELGRIEASGLERLARRILTEREKEALPEPKRRKLEYIAGRFAAKEAISKALGTGIGGLVSFMDMEILADGKGAPCVTISSEAHQRLFGQKLVRIHCSISHSEQYVMAMAVAEEIL